MLQQTRVETVIPYYERFLARWPDVAALASAAPDEVRAAWSGLGYYRRAALMMRAAAAVAQDGGRFPQTFEALSRLPGLGRYTAGAVASIAFDEPVPAVDGNVLRVLARVDQIEGDVTQGEANRAVWSVASALAACDDPGDLNQGLIEIGALVCTPKRPACGACPLTRLCRARRNDAIERIPPPKKRPTRRVLEVTALLHLDDDRVLLERQPEEGLFGGLWCLPMLEGRLDDEALIDEAARKYDLQVDAVEAGFEVKHVLTHRDILMRVARLGGDLDARGPSMLRAELSRLDELGVPSATVRALRAGLPAASLRQARLPGRRAFTRRKPVRQ